MLGGRVTGPQANDKPDGHSAGVTRLKRQPSGS